MLAARMAVVGIVLAAVACATDGMGPDDPALQLDRDVALFAADAAGQDVEIMRGPGGRFGLGLPAGIGSFECAAVERPGMTVVRTCAFYDADGAAQDAYDAETTERVVIHVEMTGSVERGEWGASSITRVRDLTVTGLAGAETSATWNGTGSGTMSRIHQTRDGDEVQMDMTSSETITDLVIPVPRTDDGWPLSGTITKTVTLTITGGPRDGTTYEREITITFNGTQYATVTIGNQTFTVDLANRRHMERHGERERHGPGPRGSGGH